MFAGTSNNLNMEFTDINGSRSTVIKIRNDHGELFVRNKKYQKEIGINYRRPEMNQPMTLFKAG